MRWIPLNTLSDSVFFLQKIRSLRTYIAYICANYYLCKKLFRLTWENKSSYIFFYRLTTFSYLLSATQHRKRQRLSPHVSSDPALPRCGLNSRSTNSFTFLLCIWTRYVLVGLYPYFCSKVSKIPFSPVEMRPRKGSFSIFIVARHGPL